MFIGAVENPFAPPHDYRPARLAKKVAAGAQFFQTQYCFDVPMLKSFMQRVRSEGLDKRCFIIVGVGPLASARSARWMRSHVPGVHIPESVIARLERSANQRAEGKRLCIELMQEIREIPGVAGIHVMAYRQEPLVAEIIAESRVLGNREPTRHSELAMIARESVTFPNPL
jgi:5,10-methylenetetrahydrofolate reductase